MKVIENILRPLALTFLRIGVGIIMVAHGWLKLVDMQAWIANVDALGIPWPGILAWFSMLAELLGGLALIVGFLTPLAGLAIFINMLVAIFVVHLDNGLLAQNNGFEYPLALALISLYFVFRGAGALSIDGALAKSRASAKKRHEVERAPQRQPAARPAEAPG